MLNKKLLLISVITLAIVIIFVAIFILISNSGKPSSNSTQNQEDVDGYLKYENAYNGLLFAVSEKTGSEAPFDQLFDNMDRNGVDMSVLYFGYEVGDKLDDESLDEDDDELADDLEDEEVDFLVDELELIIKTNKDRPGKIITFYSTGVGAQSEGRIAGDQLVDKYSQAYNNIESRFPGLVQGIGEVEIVGWDMPHNDPRVLKLMDFANERNLNVMLHPAVGKIGQFEDIIKKYPKINFIMHMFHNDYRVERENIINLMKTYTNLFYTIDTDHLMFDNEASIGLLYKYQNEPVSEGVEGFLRDYSNLFDTMLAEDIALYGQMVEDIPDKVMWGTEMSSDYTYDSRVYDKIIEFSRRFIGSFDENIQKKLAYDNAFKVFVSGVTID